jgi:hypothetical protein
MACTDYSDLLDVPEVEEKLQHNALHVILPGDTYQEHIASSLRYTRQEDAQ